MAILMAGTNKSIKIAAIDDWQSMRRPGHSPTVS